jgi:hypothetical protein
MTSRETAFRDVPPHRDVPAYGVRPYRDVPLHRDVAAAHARSAGRASS